MVNITIIKEKENDAQLTYQEWQAFLQKFAECSCPSGSALACPSCQEFNRCKYDWEDDPRHYKTNGVY